MLQLADVPEIFPQVRAELTNTFSWRNVGFSYGFLGVETRVLSKDESFMVIGEPV